MTADQPAPLDLGAIRGRVEAATEGPWRTVDERGQKFALCADGTDLLVESEIGLICETDLDGLNECAEPDAAFIAHARTDVPALLAEVERLRAVVEAVEAVMTKIGRWHNTEHDRVFTGRAGPELRDTLRQVYKDLRAALTELSP